MWLEDQDGEPHHALKGHEENMKHIEIEIGHIRNITICHMTINMTVQAGASCNTKR